MFHSPCLVGDQMSNICALHQLLLHGNQKVDSINDHLNKLNFRETKTVGIRNVKCSVVAGCVNSSST